MGRHKYGEPSKSNDCSIDIDIGIVHTKPNGSLLPQAGRALRIAVKAKCRLDAAKPDAAMERFGITVPWTDAFVEELKIGLVACRVL